MISPRQVPVTIPDNTPNRTPFFPVESPLATCSTTDLTNSQIGNTPGLPGSPSPLFPPIASPVPLLFQEDSLPRTRRAHNQAPFIATLLKPIRHDKEIKLLFKECGSWRKECENRLANSRAIKKLDPKGFSDDQITINEYKEILFYFMKPTEDDQDLFIAISKNGCTQGMARCHKETKTELYVNTLFTAYWNLTMKGTISEELEMLRVQGIGVTLMSVLCQVALQIGCTKLSLSSSERSDGFYQHIGMQSHKSGSYFLNLLEPLPLRLTNPLWNWSSEIFDLCFSDLKVEEA